MSKKSRARAIEKPKGSGKWIVYVSWNGKRQQATAPDRRSAEKKAREINMKILDGSFQLVEDQPIKTFGDYSKIYLQNCAIKPSTKSDYISMLKKHIIPVFGETRVDKITRLDIKTFLRRKLGTGLTKSTVDHLKACMCNIFDAAYDDEAIQQNPAARLGRIIGRNQEAHTSGVRPIFLNREELSRLLDMFLSERPTHYPLCLLLARTGMRVGEAVALKWHDIDFGRRVIHLRRAKARTIIDTTKSGKSRDVDMSMKLTQVLQDLKRKRAEQEIKSGKRAEWVFPGKFSDTLDATAWRRRTFDVMVRMAGLPKMRVHDLRHTYASLLIENGQPLIYIQRQLGHHSIQITADTYGHLIPKEDKGAVDSLDETLQEKEGRIKTK